MEFPRIGARALRQDLATHLRRAGAGQRLVVTSGRKAAAMLGPVEPDDVGPTLDTLVAAGLLVPPRRDDPPRAGAAVAVWSGVRLDRALRDVRG